MNTFWGIHAPLDAHLAWDGLHDKAYQRWMKLPRIPRDEILKNMFNIDRNFPQAPPGQRYYSIRARDKTKYPMTRGTKGGILAHDPWKMIHLDCRIPLTWIMAHRYIYNEALRIILMENEIEFKDMRDLYMFLRHLDRRHDEGRRWLRRVRIDDPASAYASYALNEFRHCSQIRTLSIGYCRMCRETRSLGRSPVALRRQWTGLPADPTRPKFADEISFWESERPGRGLAHFNGCTKCWYKRAKWAMPPHQPIPLHISRIPTYHTGARQSLFDWGNSIAQTVQVA